LIDIDFYVRYGVFLNIFEPYQLVFNQIAQRVQFFGSNDTQIVAGPGIFAQVKECNDVQSISFDVRKLQII
jgi:hypothetical protein